MAKKISVGVNGAAHKGTKIWVGGTDGKARKGKKAWIGDASGKARLFFSGFEPCFIGFIGHISPTELTIVKSQDFKNWTTLLYRGSASQPSGDVYFVNNKYFTIVGATMSIINDGETINTVTLPSEFSSKGAMIRFYNNRYYLLGMTTSGTTIYVSDNCYAWTKLSSVSLTYYTDTYAAVDFLYGYGPADASKKMFYCIYNGTAYASDDCVTWSSCRSMYVPALDSDGYIYFITASSTQSNMWLYKASTAIATVKNIMDGRSLSVLCQSPFNKDALLVTTTYAGESKLYKIDKSTASATEVISGSILGNKMKKRYSGTPSTTKICCCADSGSVYVRYAYLSSETAWTYFAINSYVMSLSGVFGGDVIFD